MYNKLNAILVLTSYGIIQIQSMETKKSAPPSPIESTGRRAACRQREGGNEIWTGTRGGL